MGFLEKVCRFKLNKMLKRKLSQASTEQNPKKQMECQPIAPPQTDSPTGSRYFLTPEFPQKFLNIQLELNSELKPIKFEPPVAYVYNPVEYAFKPNESYVTKFCQTPKKLLLVGMNPGPFGMCQTGVPFGEIKAVRDWLQIEEEVGKPESECPQRPILGFACEKSEVSGERLWNLIKKLCLTPEVFFKNCFVYNYCPLAMMRSDGRNLTPSDIKDTKLLESICDRYFFKVIQLLQPEIIVGIGRYAERRTLQTLKENTSDLQVKVLCLVHPSPRVVNNNNWPEKAEKFFHENDLLKIMKNESN